MTVRVGVSVGSGVAVAVMEGTGVNVAVGTTGTWVAVGVAVGEAAALQEARKKAIARLVTVKFGKGFFLVIVHLIFKRAYVRVSYHAGRWASTGGGGIDDFPPWWFLVKS